MALRIRGYEAFERLIVYGVNTTLDSEESATALEELFHQHHYDRGFSLLKQGTPTNNTENVASGYPPEDPQGQNSFNIERGPGGRWQQRDGQKFAEALGIAPSSLDHIENVGGGEQAAAEAMARALFAVSHDYIHRKQHNQIAPSAARKG